MLDCACYFVVVTCEVTPGLYAEAMPEINIRIDGVDRAVQRLGAVESARVLEQPMREAVLMLEADMKMYPPQRGGGRYRRTGTLGRRWTHRIRFESGGVTGVVGNNTSYAPLVQSSAFQTAVHRGRWQTDRSVLQRRRKEIVDRFRAAIGRALARGNA